MKISHEVRVLFNILPSELVRDVVFFINYNDLGCIHIKLAQCSSANFNLLGNCSNPRLTTFDSGKVALQDSVGTNKYQYLVQ